jgi:hypothetical protein
MFLISIDPHKTEDSGIAIFEGERPKLTRIYRWPLPVLLNFSMPNYAYPDWHAVIELPYAGKNLKHSIELATICGQIKQVFAQQEFEVHWAEAWGSKGAWTRQVLGRGKAVPKREAAKRLSLMKAKGLWPEFDLGIDEHTADAMNIGQGFLDNYRQNKHE